MVEHRDGPGRRRPVHWTPVDTGNLTPIVFVTVCTKDRRKILASDDAVAAILNAWNDADSWRVGRYVVMPDHLHPFCAPVRQDVSLNRWVKFWKARASLAWPQHIEHPIWQSDFWDTQLRRGQSYREKWEYVFENPVRHGLAAQPDEWPWAGELHELPWHDA